MVVMGSQSNDACARVVTACCQSLQLRFFHERNMFLHAPQSQNQVRQLLNQVMSGNLVKIREESDPHVIAGLVLHLLKNMPTSVIGDVQTLVMETGTPHLPTPSASSEPSPFFN